MSVEQKPEISDDIDSQEYVDGDIKVDQYGNPIIEDHLAHHDEILSEEVVHEEDMLEEIEYVDELAGEVILDGNGDAVLDEMATESLVALSQGSKNLGKNVEYVQHLPARDTMRSPRILRRPIIGQRISQYDQSSSRQPVSKPNYPVPSNTKRLLPVATLQINRPRVDDWREAQKRDLEVSEIMDALPNAHMRNTFQRILESTMKGVPAQVFRTIKTSGHRTFPTSRDYGDVPHETAARIYKGLTSDLQSKVSSESEQLEQQANEIEHQKKMMDVNDYNDMPQLEEAPEGENGPGNEVQIDVEHYDSNEDDQMQYIMDDELVEDGDLDYGEDDNIKINRVVGTRDTYYADPTYRESVVSYQDGNRFCPGCKLNLKRSIYYHHSRMIRKYGICNMFTPKRFPCGVPGCDEKMGTVEKLCEHMHQIHNAPTNIKSVHFQTSEEFEIFLRELEAKGGNFRMSRGNKMIKTGMVQYFRCNRTQAMAKEKTMRICDEVGIFGEPVGSGVVETSDDPFININTGGKPQLRTEDACTAFFRKAFLPDGSIEVRYCDHHLHEDERVRLPPIVKERIYEMHRKTLQPPVILMVIKEELKSLTISGSAVERKVANLTVKDISAVISTRNSNARKRHKARTEGRNTAADCEELAIDQTLSLTTTERKCLEEYMSNEPQILRELAEAKKKENRRRQLREQIRTSVFHLGRYVKTSNFTEMGLTDMENVAELVKNAANITRMKSNAASPPPPNPSTPSKIHLKSEYRPVIVIPQNGSSHNLSNDSYPDDSVITEGHVNIDDSYLTVSRTFAVKTENYQMSDEAGSSGAPILDRIDNSADDQEQQLVDREIKEEIPPPKKKRGRRPKSGIPPAPKPVAPPVQYEPEFMPEPVNLGAKTSSGRVVKRNRNLLD